jgi:putative hydrolase of the HAD superfamily
MMPANGHIGMFAGVISRTVILDLDDTLIVEEEVARTSLRRAAGLVAGRDPGTVVDVVLAAARRIWRAGPDYPLCHQLGFASWEGLWATFEGGPPILDDVQAWAPVYRQEAWRAALAELGIDDPALATSLSDAYVASQRSGHPLIDGAAELVHSLEGRCRLGLLTNGPADIQRFKIASTGLGDCFGAVVISGEVGLGKPDPDIFALTLAQLGAKAESAVMVGDSWERDIIGALDAGLEAVWVAAGRALPEKRPSVTVVGSVGELVGRSL